MAAPWTLFTKALGPKDEEPGRAVSRAPDPAPPPPRALPEPAPPAPPAEEMGRSFSVRGPLDEVGQQSEQVRERISSLSVRLDELKSLADDFGQIVQPVSDFVLQHAQTRSKLLESEALLARERELSAVTRAELNDLHKSAARTSGDLAAAVADLRSHQHAMREQDAMLTQMRLRIDDQGASIDSLERQIASETERARSLSDDNQTLRNEIDALDQFKSRAEGELSEMREQLGTANTENARLQHLAEGLSQRVSGLKGQMQELEPQIQAGRQEIAMLQAKLSTEQLARQKLEVTRETERSAQDAEIAALSMKIEGLNAHVGATDKILTNLKDQLRDKSEALRVSEKALKDAHGERTVVDRRLDSSLEVVGRHQAQIGELQRANGELKDRCEMLAKALSAKESVIDGGARKIANLTGRIDQINARFEQERASFEAANRRLIEELQSEKAERSLAQGALDIARNSRSKLLTQYTALKRQQSLSGGGRTFDVVVDDDLTGRDTPDNVRAFKGNDRSE